MNMIDALTVAARRGVQLCINGDDLRARGPKGSVNDALKESLTEHKAAIIEALGDGVFPDVTLPDEIVIPAHVPNDVEALCACIDAQREGQKAA
jgi:hypothetical protein